MFTTSTKAFGVLHTSIAKYPSTLSRVRKPIVGSFLFFMIFPFKYVKEQMINVQDYNKLMIMSTNAKFALFKTE
jgi:hypothetical protein